MDRLPPLVTGPDLYADLTRIDRPSARRGRRHGRGVSRARCKAESRCRAEGAARALSHSIPTASRGSSAKRRCWPRSIIRTSPRSTASKSRAMRARSCWSWSTVRRWPIVSHAARCRSSEALDRRASGRRRARSGAREGHHSSRPQAGEHQDRRNGAVKVLDFGLAKAFGRSPPPMSRRRQHRR